MHERGFMCGILRMSILVVDHNSDLLRNSGHEVFLGEDGERAGNSLMISLSIFFTPRIRDIVFECGDRIGPEP